MKTKLIKKIYNLNRGWWDSFSSCFIGTLLGIGLTFAISGYLEEQKKEETARKILIMAIYDLDREMNILEKHIGDLQHSDSIFTQVLDRYPDKLNTIPADTVGLFLSNMTDYKFFGHDKSVENIFMNNIEVWNSIDDLSVVKILNDCFTFKAELLNLIGQCETLKREMQNNFYAENYMMAYHTHTEAINSFFKNQKNANLLLNYHLYVSMTNFLLSTAQQLVTNIKTEMDIEDKDFDIMQNSNINNIENSETIQLQSEK